MERGYSDEQLPEYHMECRVGLSPKLGGGLTRKGKEMLGRPKKAETTLLQIIHLQGAGRPIIGDFNAINHHGLYSQAFKSVMLTT